MYGYKWKNKARKKIKKNEHKKGYYKCTHSNCQAKKKFHWSDDGTVEYFTYINQYNHPDPQLRIVPLVVLVVPIVEQGQH